MSVIALLSTTPARSENTSEEVAGAVEALGDYDVDPTLTAMGTIIETDDVGELFAAVEAAHRAVDADRVTTKLEIDHERDRDRGASARVSAVEEMLGDGSASDGPAGTNTTTDDSEELDSVDMSGHAPEDTEDAPEEDAGMKGGDYKTADSEADDEPISEKYGEETDGSSSD
ncbi:thiamine-binding protein [Halococcus hamelinensis]|uniref:Thiamine-binding protein domain-containing protein n=1 Tax=Halococcus hamelinensis 100A6 TaxID=1132509 RepID=M0M9C2_9EURY|nr:thiamine-binding protein [Halococcus hamelinensis]EMA41229.1 hypothetical protein C447_02252 [Halococcus hamelinensis 100A6]